MKGSLRSSLEARSIIKDQSAKDVNSERVMDKSRLMMMKIGEKTVASPANYADKLQKGSLNTSITSPPPQVS